MGKRALRKFSFSFLILLGFYLLIGIGTTKVSAENIINDVSEEGWTNGSGQVSLTFTMNENIKEYNNFMVNISKGFLSFDDIKNNCNSDNHCTPISFSELNKSSYTFDLPYQSLENKEPIYYYAYISDDDYSYGSITLSKIDNEKPEIVFPAPVNGDIKSSTIEEIKITHSYKKDENTGENIDLVAPIKSIVFKNEEEKEISLGEYKIEYLYDEKGKSKEELKITFPESIKVSGSLKICDAAENCSVYRVISDITPPTYEIKMTKDNGLMITLSEKVNAEESYIILKYETTIYNGNSNYSTNISETHYFKDLTCDSTETIYYLPVQRKTKYQISFYLADLFENFATYGIEEEISFDTTGSERSENSPINGGYYTKEELETKELSSNSSDTTNEKIYYSIEYSNDWGPYIEYTSMSDLLKNISFSKEGQVKWYIQNTTSGNVSDDYTFVYDTTEPEVNSEITYSYTGKKIDKKYSGSLTITFPETSDNGSGVLSQKYVIKINDDTYEEGFIDNLSNRKLTIPNTISGEINIKVTITNNVGLTNELEDTITLDNTKPTITKQPHLAKKGENQIIEFSKKVTTGTYKIRTYNVDTKKYTDSSSTSFTISESDSTNIVNYLTQANKWYIFQFKDSLDNMTNEIAIYVYEDINSFISGYSYSNISCTETICSTNSTSNSMVNITFNTAFIDGLMNIDDINSDTFTLFSKLNTSQTTASFISSYDVVGSSSSRNINPFEGTEVSAGTSYYWHLAFSFENSNKAVFKHNCVFKLNSSTVNFLNNSDLIGGLFNFSNGAKISIENISGIKSAKMQFDAGRNKIDFSNVANSTEISLTGNSGSYLHILATLDDNSEIYYISPAPYYSATSESSANFFVVDANGNPAPKNMVYVNSNNVIVSDVTIYYQIVYNSAAERFKMIYRINNTSVPQDSIIECSDTNIIKFKASLKGVSVGSNDNLSIKIQVNDADVYSKTMTVVRSSYTGESEVLFITSNNTTDTFDDTSWYQGNLNLYVNFASSYRITDVYYAILKSKTVEDNTSSNLFVYLEKEGYFTPIGVQSGSGNYDFAKINLNLADNTYKVFIKATTSNNEQYIRVINVQVDSTKPTINIAENMVGIKDNNHIDKNAQTIQINYTASDKTSGINNRSCEVSNSNFGCAASESSLTITYVENELSGKETSVVITLSVEDKAGNKETYQKTLYLDLKGPTISSIKNSLSGDYINTSFKVNDNYSYFSVYFMKGEISEISTIKTEVNKLECTTSCSVKVDKTSNSYFTIYAEDEDGNGTFNYLNLKIPSNVKVNVIEENGKVIKKDDLYYTNGNLRVSFENTSEYTTLEYYFSTNLNSWKSIGTSASSSISFSYDTSNLGEGTQSWYIKVKVKDTGLEAIILLNNIYFDISGPTVDITYFGFNNNIPNEIKTDELDLRCEAGHNKCYFNYETLRYQFGIGDITDNYGIGVDKTNANSKITLKYYKNSEKTNSERTIDTLAHYNGMGTISSFLQATDVDTTTAEGNYVLKIYLYDELGNENIIEKVLVIDRSPDEIKYIKYDTAWARSLKVNAGILENTTVQSPISSIYYWSCEANNKCDKPDNSNNYKVVSEKEMNNLTFDMVINKNGYWNVEINDMAGNTSIYQFEQAITNIDEVGPSICYVNDCTGNENEKDYFSYEIENANFSDKNEGLLNWTNQDVIIIFKENKDTSNSLSNKTSPDYIQWKYSGNSSWNSVQADSNGQIILTFSEEKEHNILIRAIDLAGINENENPSEISLKIRIDKTKPELGKLNGYEENSWTNEDVTITIGRANDTLSGIKEVSYKIGNNSDVSYTNGEEPFPNLPFECDENKVCVYTLTLKAVDNAGNETVKEILIKIDKVAPNLGNIQIFDENGDVYNSEDWTKQELTVVLEKGNDGADCSNNKCSGVKGNYISFDNGNEWKTFDEEGELVDGKYKIVLSKTTDYQIKIKIVDNAGNEVISSQTYVVRLDFSAPKVTISYQMETEKGSNEFGEVKDFNIDNFGNDTWYNKKIKLIFNIKDEESGIQSKTISIWKKLSSEANYKEVCIWRSTKNSCTSNNIDIEYSGTDNDLTVSFLLKKDGFYNFTYKVTDKLDNITESNETEDSKKIQIDMNENIDYFNSGEIIVVGLSDELKAKEWLNYNDLYECNGTNCTLQSWVNASSITMKGVDIKDSLSGVEMLFYTLNGETFENYGYENKQFSFPSIDGIYQIYIKVIDGAGNISTSNVIEIKIDTKAPIKDSNNDLFGEIKTVDFQMISYDNMTIYVKNGKNPDLKVPVNYASLVDEFNYINDENGNTFRGFTLKAKSSGIAKVQYRLSDGTEEWLDLGYEEGQKGYIELNDAGTYNVYVRVIDKAGNIYEYNEVKKFQIITSIPNLNEETININGEKYDKDKWYGNLEDNKITISINANSADYLYFSYYVEAVEEDANFTENIVYNNQTTISSSRSKTITVSDKIYKARIRAIIKANDNSYYEGEFFEFKLKIDLPDNLDVTYQKSTDEITREDITVTGTISGSESGIKSVSYTVTDSIDYEDLDFSSVEVIDNVFTIIADNGGKYVFKIIDNAGNTVYKEYEVYNVDKEAPVIDVVISDEEVYKTSHNIIVNITDNNAYTLKYLLSSSKYNEEELREEFNKDKYDELTEIPVSSLNYEETGIYYLYIYAIDAAGNETYKESNAILIDKTAPTINAPSGIEINKWYGNDVSIEFNGALDEHSGFAKYQYKFSADAEWQDYEEPISVTENGSYTFYYQGIDNAGNIAEATFIPFGIDKEIPTIKVSTDEDTSQIVKEKSFKYSASVTVGISGIKELKYIKITEEKYNNKELTVANFDEETSINTETKEFEISNSGYYAVIIISKSSLYAIDYFENMLIDNKKPEIKIEGISEKWVKDCSSIQVSIDDIADDNNVSSGLNSDTISYFISSEKLNINDLTKDKFTTEIKISSFTISDIPSESGKYYIYIYSEDNVGNVTKFESNPIKIDTSTPYEPQYEFIFNDEVVTSNKNDWNRGPLKINIKKTETEYSPVVKVYYKIYSSEANEEEIEYEIIEVAENPDIIVEVAETGKYTIKAYVENEAGTLSNENVLEFWVDAEKPTLGSWTVNGEEEVSDWYQDFNLAVEEGNDEHSGYDYSYYKWYTKNSEGEYGLIKEDRFTTLNISESGFHKVVFYALDKVGNNSLEEEIEFGIDKEKDEVKFDYNEKLTNKDLEVVVSIVNKISETDTFTYILSDVALDKTTYQHENASRIVNNKIVVENNCYINIYVKDQAGNENYLSKQITNIDKIPPEFDLFIDTEEYRQNHTIGIEYKEDISNIDKVKYYFGMSETNPSINSFKGNGEGAISQVSSSFTNETGIRYLHIAVYDKAGNYTIKTSSAMLFDNTKPINGTAYIESNGEKESLNDNTWAMNFTISISDATDTNSGFDVIMYKIEGMVDEYTLYENPITVDVEGKYILSFKAVDKAGNESDVTQINFGVDRTSPSIENIEYDNETFSNTVKTIKVEAKDEGSGVKEVGYGKNSENLILAKFENGYYVFDISENDTYTIVVTDNVGNFVTDNIMINSIDKVKPSADVTISNNGEWQLSSSAFVRVNAIDNGGNNSARSGVSYIKYCWSTLDYNIDVETFLNACSNPLEIKVDDDANESENSKEIFANLQIPNESGKHYIYLIVADKAGNIAIAEKQMLKIDNTNPSTPSVKVYANEQLLDNEAIVNSDVFVYITMVEEDTTSGINHYEYKVNEGSWNSIETLDTVAKSLKYSEENKYVIVIKAVDNVGLESEEVTVIFTIDKTAPILEEAIGKYSSDDSIYQFGEWTNQNIKIVLPNASDDCELKKLEYRVSNGAWKEYTTNDENPFILSVSKAGQNVIEVKATDTAGNETSASYQIWIDKEAPVVGSLMLNPNVLVSTTAPSIVQGKGSDKDSGFKEYRYQVYQNNTLYSDWELLTDDVVLPSLNYGEEIQTSYRVVVKAIDNAGNESSETSLYYIINKEGYILSLVADKEDFTNEDINIEVVLNDNIQEYLKDKTFKIEYVKGKPLQGLTLNSYDSNGYVGIEIKNENGYKFVASENSNYIVVLKIEENGEYKTVMLQGLTISNIDKIAPSISIDVATSEWVLNLDNVKVYVNEINSYSGIKEINYYWKNTNGNSETSTIKIDEKKTLYHYFEVEAPTSSGSYELVVEVSDYAGNITTLTSNQVKIDRTAPVSGKLSISPSGVNWHNGYYDLRFESDASDYGSGFSHYEYRLLKYIDNEWVDVVYNNGTYLEIAVNSWKTLNTYLRVYASSGKYKVEFKVVDRVGNESKVFDSGEFSIDNEIPTLEVKCNEKVCSNEWYGEEVTLTFNAEDSLSGVERIEYRVGTGSWNTVIENELRFAKEGTNNLSVRAVDKAGNYSQEQLIVLNIDSSQDSIALNVNSLSWTNETSKVYISIQGNISPVSNIVAYFNDIQIEVFKDEKGYYIEVSDNGTVRIEYTDMAGNNSQTSAEITIFDRVNPSFEVDVKEGEYKQEHLISIVGKDDNSAIKAINYEWKYEEVSITGSLKECIGSKVCNSKITSPSESGIWNLSITIIDNAGNEYSEEFGTYKVDVTSPIAPVATWSLDKTIVNNYNGIFTVSAGEDIHSGINTNKYQIWKNKVLITDWTSCDEGTEIYLPNEDGVYKLIIKSIDNVGLESSNTYEVTLDTVADELVLTPNITSWTNQDVVVSLKITNSTSKIVAYRYLMGEKTIEDFVKESSNIINDQKFSCKSNGTYTVYIRDEAGNERIAYITISNIDKVKPVVKNTVDNEIKTSFVFNVEVSDKDSGLKTILYYWKAGEEKIGYVTKNNLSGNDYLLENVTSPSKSGTWTLVIEVTDQANNSYLYEFAGYKVDLFGPSITGVYDENFASLVTDSWFNSNLKIIDVVCEDNFFQEGNLIYYKINDQEWTLYEEDIVIEDEGKYTLSFKAIDSLNNEGTESSFVIYIDKTAPVIVAEDVIVPYNGTFTHNYQVSDNLDPNIAENINIKGTVDTSVAGEYKITYEVVDAAGLRGFKVITVVVQSEIVPIIQIDTTDIIVEVCTDYQLPTATIIDNGQTFIIAGISDFNVNTLGTYTITYSYSNKAGQSVSATRKIIVKDTTAPVFDFKNLNKKIIKGNDFSYQYVTVSDNYDEEVTFTVSGEVNTSKIGKYELTFTAVDSSNNEKTEKIIIEVVKKEFEFNPVLFVEITVITLLVGVVASFPVRAIKRKKENKKNV